MIFLHLSVFLSTLLGMKFLFDSRASMAPLWFEVLEAYEYCHHHIKVTSNGLCWADGVQVDCLQVGLSSDTVSLLECVKPATEILSLLGFFVCVNTHLFYKSYDKQWCTAYQMKCYRAWILFSMMMAIGAGVTSTAMSVTLAIVTAYEQDGKCNHAVKAGWAIALVILLTVILIVLANSFVRESGEMLNEMTGTDSESTEQVDEEKVLLLLPSPEEKA